MLQFGDYVRYFRKSAKMSQEELALKVGYSGKAAIARVEANEIDPPQSKILAIANALGISVGMLFGATELTNEEMELILAYRNSSQNSKQAVRLILGVD